MHACTRSVRRVLMMEAEAAEGENDDGEGGGFNYLLCVYVRRSVV